MTGRSFRWSLAMTYRCIVVRANTRVTSVR
jgi:hypothetical protein